MLRGSNQGTLFSLREEVRRIRTVYSGDLIIVLDACYSGQAFRDITSVAYDERTAVLASSSDDQQSEALKIKGEGNQLKSAFTYALTQVLRGSEPPPCDSGSAAPICRSIDDGVLGIDKLAKAVRVSLAKLPLKHKVDPVVHVFATDPVGMVGYFCETVRNLDSDDRSIESGTSEVLSAVSAAYSSDPSRLSDNEALGITDDANNVLAIVSVHVSKGKIAAVTVNSLIDKNLSTYSSMQNPSNVKLNVVSLELGPQTQGPGSSGLSFKKFADLSNLASKAVVQSLATQVSLRKKEGEAVASSTDLWLATVTATGRAAPSKTILLEDVNAVPPVLSEDAAGKVVFDAANPVRVHVDAKAQAAKPY